MEIINQSQYLINVKSSCLLYLFMFSLLIIMNNLTTILFPLTIGYVDLLYIILKLSFSIINLIIYEFISFILLQVDIRFSLFSLNCLLIHGIKLFLEFGVQVYHFFCLSFLQFGNLIELSL